MFIDHLAGFYGTFLVSRIHDPYVYCTCADIFPAWSDASPRGYTQHILKEPILFDVSLHQSRPYIYVIIKVPTGNMMRNIRQ